MIVTNRMVFRPLHPAGVANSRDINTTTACSKKSSSDSHRIRPDMYPGRAILSSNSSDRKARVDVPEDDGILIFLASDGSVRIETVPDAYYPLVHPNCYAPAGLTDVALLKGGGSGTAVFAGHDPQFGSLVLKHANPKDTLEIFSLVKVADELLQRQSFAPDEATFLKQRIPEFQFAYLSPVHLRDRKKEKWMSVKRNLRFLINRLSSALSNNSLTSASSANSLSSNMSDQETSSLMDAKLANMQSIGERMPVQIGRAERQEGRLSLLAEKPKLRCLSIVPGLENCLSISPKFKVTDDTVEICVPGLQSDGSVEEGIAFLNDFAHSLSLQQKENRWKVTLAQKTIGGPTSENGAFVMTSGRLKGPMLKTLVNEFTKVVQSLKAVTRPEERHVLHALRSELEILRMSRDVTMVTKEMDAYVGSCIMKNFHPTEGRYVKLRKYGKLFREKFDRVFLTPDEVLPARLLGLMLERGSDMARVFVEPPPGKCCALDIAEDHWLTVIEFAAALDHVPSATECIWTCGLTDAGLHNCFLSEDRGLELFDLGEPKLIPQPAFLTKFLMSIFHVYGMEENLAKVDGTGWVHRFHIAEDGRLQLNDGMHEKIEYMFQVYEEAANAFVEKLFQGEDLVRRLLASYAVLQLLSDAGFCINRWEEKGGGAKHEERPSFAFSHKWLWRSIWDIYIASFVYHRLIPGAPRLQEGWKLQEARKQSMNGSGT